MAQEGYYFSETSWDVVQSEKDMTSMDRDFFARAKDLRAGMVACRRDLHRHPELGFQEERTAAMVARELTTLGLQVRTQVGRTGVVGVLEGPAPGPTLMVRFDMDALPIAEAGNAEYASQVPGVMHACGHDGHTAVGLAVARMFSELRSQLAGRIKFVFQPAEEMMVGALAMIADGVLENPVPERVLGFHLINDKPVGWVAAPTGPMMAAGGRLDITLHGRGAHGALAHQGKDPIVAAAHIVSALQTVVSRNVNALDSAVVSITSIHGGEAFNIIPGVVRLQGTIRALKPDVYEAISRRTEEIVCGLAEAMECKATVEQAQLSPAVINDAETSSVVRAQARELPIVKEVVEEERVMASEDVSHFLSRVPGCFFFVGSVNIERHLNYPHHHPNFDFDEDALVLAAALMAKSVAHYLLPGPV
jgi:amidohydrolase